ncbi:hypothetical protein NEFER03_0217 [Nematocida sp. LUAm3]|nr:hypothetical protein NEFER03_0217 [Nematocida sp. LUAm3]KAI5173670.1 hypothetical protein NEFER02_0186 [Nematocida sp. LUAm2]KAI5176891.1 hypothetical protein NEFER01_0216 [Nematocida sp. LUAm1]
MNTTQLVLLLIYIANSLAYQHIGFQEYYPENAQFFAYPLDMEQAIQQQQEEIIFQAINEAANSPDPEASLTQLIDEVALTQDNQNKKAFVAQNTLPPGTFVLTFDEGPSFNIAQALNTLRKYKKVCAFHLDPYKISSLSIPYVEDILKANHVVGLAIVAPTSLRDMTVEESREYIDNAFTAFQKKLGWSPTSVRLPRQGYSTADVEYCINLGMIVSEPNYDSGDYCNPLVLEALRDTLLTTSPRDTSFIVVQRDKSISSIDHIDHIIKEFNKNGYTMANYTDIASMRSLNKPNTSYLKAISAQSNGILCMDLDIKSPPKSIADNSPAAILLTGPAKKILPKAEVLAVNGATSALRIISIGGVITVIALFI